MKKSILPTVSAIIATRNRPEDLAEALMSLLNQSYPPSEVIVIDDSRSHSSKVIINSLSLKFLQAGSDLKYVLGDGDGLPAARNLGLSISKGDAVLFLDDDVLLDQDVVGAIVSFLGYDSSVSGVQPKILHTAFDLKKNSLFERLQNATFKVFMLSYIKNDSLSVRRSGASVFPDELTKVIYTQRLLGCCCCYKRDSIRGMLFDTNLKLWAYGEDLDFSYRVYKKNIRSLCALPNIKVVHKTSATARLQRKTQIYMKTIYSFYVFFKDVFDYSALNLSAFLWRLAGQLIINIGVLIVRRKPTQEWWEPIYLVKSYLYAFLNLYKIKEGNLLFFNKQFKGGPVF
jgi:GT2 family glycosyltransferase